MERPFFQLAHNLVVTAPGLGWLRKFGTVAATPENARLALQAGRASALLVYPPAATTRSSGRRGSATSSDFGGRKGYVQLAREAGVPIVPIASVGGQETALFLDRGAVAGQAAARRQDAAAQERAHLPGAAVGAQHQRPGRPLPAACEDHHRSSGTHRRVDGDDDAVNDAVLSSLQSAVDRLAAERRFQVIG